MAARLRRAEPAFADRSPSGPAKSGFVPAVRVPTGEPAASTAELRVCAHPGAERDLGAGDPIPFPPARNPGRRTGLPGPVVLPVPVVAAPRTAAAGRPATGRGPVGPRWSGFASVLLHLGVALPFLIAAPSRDLPASGGEAETFEVEIVPSGEAEADRLAQAGAAPPFVAVVPAASASLATVPPDLPTPPEDAPAPADPGPDDPAPWAIEAVRPVERAAETPPVVATPMMPPPPAASDAVISATARSEPTEAPSSDSIGPEAARTPAASVPPPTPPPRRAPAVVPREPPSRPSRPDRVAAQPRPQAPAPAVRPGADRSDGGSSATTSRAGTPTTRGDGQAGAEVLASYRNRVLAHLARHKQYPDSARDRGIEGRVAVTFTLSASGQVVAAGLAGSSGRPELDRITLATVQRASPFPPIPPGGPATMTFRTALRYDLR